MKLDPSKSTEPPFSSICQQPTSVGSISQAGVLVGVDVGVLVGVNVGVLVSVSVGVGVETTGGGPCTEPVPESVNVLPAIGRNFQS